MMQQQFVFLTIIFSSLIVGSISKSNTISLTQPLPYGKTLVSSDKTFALGFFTPSTDSNKHYLGIWYNKIPTQTVVWVANRENPVHGRTGLLSISDNGTLSITSGNSNVIWSSSSSYSNVITDPVAMLLDSGNFVVTNGYDENNFFAWQSFDYPTDTILPGMKLGWNLTSGLNRNLTSWSSSSDPSRGNVTVAVDLRGDPQLIFWAGSTRRLRSGPWTGQYFSGLAPYKPDLNNVLMLNFVDTKQEVYFTIEAINTSSISRLVLNSLGVLQQFVLLNSGQWGLYWYTPRTQCDSYLVCGPYGAGCYVDGSPMCSCLPGHTPKNTGNWALRDWSGGCVRKTKLDCRNGTDDFVKVQRTLLPDTVSATVNSGLSLSDCRDVCLKNCSCTAYASADIRNGGNGCILWSAELSDILVYTNGGQNLFMRLAAADLGLPSSNQAHKKSNATIAIVFCLTLGMLIIVSIVLFAWRMRRRTGGSTFSGENVAENTGEDEMELPLFDLETIVEATNDFSDKNKLGEGGFGPVYKGIAREGQEIAVKRLSKTSSQGFDELKTEVILVAKLQHRNLVRLLGCCIQGDERMLIYEYMPNRSLDAFLFDEEKAVLLDWASRYHVIVGIARGLLYLHQDSRFRIIHRDLKASNILLDKDMNPKISDFGLARIFGEDETKTKTARVVGTYGYMAPEYALNGIISVKSDVFSFGVLVLEIISGKRNKGVYLSEAEEYLLGRAWTLWREGNGVQLVSSSIQHSICIDEVVRCIKVGLLCIQERPENRPTMSSVCLMLSSENTNLPEPQQPAFLLRRNSPGETTSSDSNSINDLTITMAIAR